MAGSVVSAIASACGHRVNTGPAGTPLAGSRRHHPSPGRRRATRPGRRRVAIGAPMRQPATALDITRVLSASAAHRPGTRSRHARVREPWEQVRAAGHGRYLPRVGRAVSWRRDRMASSSGRPTTPCVSRGHCRRWMRPREPTAQRPRLPAMRRQRQIRVSCNVAEAVSEDDLIRSSSVTTSALAITGCRRTAQAERVFRRPRPRWAGPSGRRCAPGRRSRRTRRRSCPWSGRGRP